MPILRLSLFKQIMIWFSLNLFVLALVFTALIGLDFRGGRPLPFFLSVNRLDSLARPITTETQDLSRAERDEVLRRVGLENRVDLFIFDDRGEQLGGPAIVLPDEVKARLTSAAGMPGPSRNNDGRPPDNAAPNNRPGSPSFYLRAGDPVRYWSGAPIFVFEAGQREPIRARLIAASDSITGHGLFFNPLPWVLSLLLVIVISAAVWFPFVRRLTKRISTLESATQRIANEDFAARVESPGNDEIGRLGSSVNHLAARLEGFVTGQRRFLGDVSHELNSPLARMQFALSILESRLTGKDRGYVDDVREEVRLMTDLVAELLRFSKTGMEANAVELGGIRLHELVEEVVGRERSAEKTQIFNEVPPDFVVVANPGMLGRALGNILRNALRYAGDNGPVTVSATTADNGYAELTVADQGDGVPEEFLDRLFDPLFRVESHRSRDSGGSGLGLAIVRTCVEACGGRVSACNLTPRGFAVKILLRVA